MELQSILTIANSSVLPAWLLLLIAPRWRWSARVICGVIVPVLLATVYCSLMFKHWSEANGDFSSIPGLLEVFKNPGLLVAGWIHYLAFDLFIGSWEARDSQQHGISYWLLAPCLVLTFVLGPIGLAAYLVVRSVSLRTVDLNG